MFNLSEVEFAIISEFLQMFNLSEVEFAIISEKFNLCSIAKITSIYWLRRSLTLNPPNCA